MIVFVDQVVWRPLVAWSHKFTDEETTRRLDSWLGERIPPVADLAGGDAVVEFPATAGPSSGGAPATRAAAPGALAGERAALDQVAARAAIGGGVLFGAVKYFHMLTTLTGR